MKFVISGGGTGGHVYPALAIVRGLQEKWPESQFLYIGSQKGIEKKIVSQEKIPFQSIKIKQGINRSHLLKSVFTACYSVPESFWEARSLIQQFRPDAVIGTGGYVSFPVVCAGEFLGYPTFIHEQNAWPGLTNRILARKATCTMLTFPEAQNHLQAKRIALTGLPVRPEILQTQREEAQTFLQLEKNRFTVLIFGGSLGAASINQATEAMLPDLLETSLQLIWITGAKHYESIQKRLQEQGFLQENHPLKIHLYPYLYEMAQAMAASDLAVCRCGAATLSELQMVGLPAVLIPYPYATENHQEKNGMSLVQQGAGVLIADSGLNAGTLREAIEGIWKNPEKQQKMREQMKSLAQPDSLQKIVAEIERGIHRKE